MPLCEKCPTSMRAVILQSLSWQARCSSRVIDLAISWFDQSPGHLQRRICSLLQKANKNLPEAIIDNILARLNDENGSVYFKIGAIQALSRQLSVTKAATTFIRARLDDHSENMDVRVVALFALTDLPSELEPTINAIAAWLLDDTLALNTLDLMALRPVPDDIMPIVLAHIENKNAEIRHKVFRLLAQQPSMITLAANPLLTVLNTEGKVLRRAAIHMLTRIRSGPEPAIVAAIAERLKDKDEDVRIVALQVLATLPSMPQDVVTAIIASLGDEDQRLNTLKALRAEPSLPKAINAAVATHLNSGIRTSGRPPCSSQ